MKTVCVLMSVCLVLVTAEIKPPQVNVYTSQPIEFGKPNELICYADGFHPPSIQVILLRDGEEIPDCKQSDLSFKQDWTYYLMKSARFTPEDGHKYECVVTHMNQQPKKFQLDMEI